QFMREIEKQKARDEGMTRYLENRKLEEQVKQMELRTPQTLSFKFGILVGYR
ncbi:MAG: hypothetical protein HQK58_16110, partial [Deltaproteobacteria bacterium]|nr:hypothetical protein [Deltaproteobacteria bacterium]